MQLALKQIIVSPGQQLLLKDISWQQLETILEELGESRAAKISYSNGLLEIMTPLLEHEKDKEIISYLVQILLEKLEIDFEALGSTTYKNKKMNQAVEPDASFYIKNCSTVIGKDRLDLSIDPPPDLAVEIDITSRTQFDNYLLLGVPELWKYTRKGLQIYLLQNSQYIQSKNSPNFPNIPIIELVDRTIEDSKKIGRSKAISIFKNWLKTNL
ncbi:MAG: Uma2 family endonuclease [Prochloraceae cyanobacterium]